MLEGLSQKDNHRFHSFHRLPEVFNSKDFTAGNWILSGNRRGQ